MSNISIIKVEMERQSQLVKEAKDEKVIFGFNIISFSYGTTGSSFNFRKCIST